MIKINSSSPFINIEEISGWGHDGEYVEIKISAPELDVMFYQFEQWKDEQEHERELRERNPELKEFYDKYKMMAKLAGELA